LVNYYMELEILNVSIKCVSAAIICFGALSRLFLTSCLSVFYQHTGWLMVDAQCKLVFLLMHVNLTSSFYHSRHNS